MKKLTIGLLLVLIISLAGCQKEKPTHTMRFYIETDLVGSAWAQPLKMPLSGLEFIVHKNPIVLERSVLSVELVKVQSGKIGFQFVMDSEGTRSLYRESVANMGKRIVTVINGVPVGARQIDGPLIKGVFYTFSELPQEEMEEMVIALQKNVKIIQEMKSSRFN